MTQIFVGKTVDDAKELAVKEFGVDSSKITFAILEEPKKTIFGKSKGEAKITASYEATKQEIAAQYIKNILIKMEITNSKVTISENDAGAVLDISGDGCEDIIGRKGETLDSLQYLASLVCNKGDKDYYRISVDCCGYREKRRAQLEELAIKIANSVIKNGRTSALEPMNPYERRIVHSAVSSIEGVASRSTGEEPYRKVIISSTVKHPEKREAPTSFNKNNNNRPQKQEIKPKSFDIKTSFEKDYKKPKPEDKLGSGLYSKIEF